MPGAGDRSGVQASKQWGCLYVSWSPRVEDQCFQNWPSFSLCPLGSPPTKHGCPCATQGAPGVDETLRGCVMGWSRAWYLPGQPRDTERRCRERAMQRTRPLLDPRTPASSPSHWHLEGEPLRHRQRPCVLGLCSASLT